MNRKGRKLICKRSRKGQGYFYNSHSYNFINRSSSSQANAISYSEYVLLNPNTKSCISRPNFNRTNSGYLKHISSQSIRKEKDQFGMGCYEVDTLRKIQNTSDMIKQQLMNSEHHPSNLTENQTNLQSVNIPLKLKSKPNRVGSETSESTDHLLVKLKRKSSKSSEEISRMQLKEKRKNALRQKFKREMMAKPKSLDSYNVKEISDKIIQHISKMNNDRLVDFLNSDNPRYEEAFSYITKQKSFELTKALRDLSMQKKPEACEIVNSIIPDFSIKIEELPIDVIRELSSTFDEMHKNIGDSCLSDEILNLFNQTGELPKSDLLSSEEIYDGNSKNGNSFNKNNVCINTESGSSQQTNHDHELIDVLDSDEEIPLLEPKNENSTTLSPCQEFDKIGIGIHHDEMKNMISASNQDGLSNDLIDTNPIQHEQNVLIDTTLPVNIENSQSLSSISPGIDSLHEESSIQTNTIIHPQDDDAHKIKDSAESLVLSNTIDLNSKPKIWVSKNIFPTSNELSAGKDPEIIVSNESLDRSSVSSENENTALNNSSYNKHYEPSLAVQKKTCSNINKSTSPTEFQEKESHGSHVSNSENCELENLRSKDDSLTEIVPLISTGSDNLQRVENTNCSSDCRNLERKSREKKQAHSKKSKKSPNIPTLENHLEKAQTKIVSTNNPEKLPTIQETSRSNEKSNPENEFISVIIKSFNKPNNLAEAIKYMKVIDENIEILNKLRQDIFITLSENISESEKTIISNTKKRKLETSETGEKNVEKSKKKVETCKKKPEISKKNVDISKTNEAPEANVEISATSGDISKKSKSQDKKKDPAKMPQFLSLKSMKVVVLFFKIMYDRGECIVGTDKGKIQYHSVNGMMPLMTVPIGNSAISFLECVWIYNTNYVCTGVTSELELKFLQYKRRYIEQRIHLKDSIQALRTEWGFFFIGGKIGYLTRYELKKDMIQYEDRISPTCIKDLRATKEGPRKILVILFEDPDGEAHVDVRDAMTALHIRTIIDIKNVTCMHLRYSSVYLFRDGEIKIYNCCDGNFIKTIKTWKSFSWVKSRGNLLLLGSTDGIYALNMKTVEFLGCLQPQISVASLIFYERKIICSTWTNEIKLYDVPDRFRQIYDIK